ncbi:MAG TPA: PorP/SprF family type IX secretion system membrane protein [Bacteroidales bacterium]|nr:PorP/SprF family type IX secretion system membrane protein [Bacteroidales bacterium]
MSIKTLFLSKRIYTSNYCINWMRQIFLKQILIGCISMFYINVVAQDVSFSHYFLNSVVENPAVTGSVNDGRVFLHYRNQLPAFGSTYVTYQGSYDKFSPKMKSGWGLNILRDNIAGNVITNTQADILYSYRFKESHNMKMQLGLQASFQFYNINTSSLNVADPNLPADFSSTQPDFGVGYLAMTRYSQFGISVGHLNRSFLLLNNTFVESPMKFSVFYSHDIELTNYRKTVAPVYTLTPALMVLYQGGSMMFDYGASLKFNNIIAGLWCRTNVPIQVTNAIASIGFIIDNWQIGYSYDYNVLSLKNIMPYTGAHEIAIVARFKQDPKRKRFGSIPCPDVIIPEK